MENDDKSGPRHLRGRVGDTASPGRQSEVSAWSCVERSRDRSFLDPPYPGAFLGRGRSVYEAFAAHYVERSGQIVRARGALLPQHGVEFQCG